MANKDKKKKAVYSGFAAGDTNKLSKEIKKLVESNKSSEKTKLGIKIQTIRDALADRKNDAKRNKFVSGIITLDLQTAMRDIDGNVVLVGDPEGIHVYYSKTSQGKTMTVFTLAAQLQKNGLRGLIIYSEQDSANDLGVLFKMCDIDTDAIMMSYDTDLEAILTTAEKYLGCYKETRKEPSIDFIIIDSLDATASKAEIKKGTAGDNMAVKAKRIGEFIRLAHPHMCKHGVRMYIISQFRAGMEGQSEYSIDSYSGGNALKHMAKTIRYIRRLAASKTRGEGARFKITQAVGITGVSSKGFPIAAKLVKTKIAGAIEGSTAYYDFYHMIGIDKLGSLFESAYKYECLDKPSGITYKFGNEIIKGVEAAKEYFISHPECHQEIIERLVEKMRFHKIPGLSGSANEEMMVEETNI